MPRRKKGTIKPPKRPGTRRPLKPELRGHLRRAHRSLENGEHANAAAIFENLAGQAHDLGYVGTAGHLLLQAGGANLLSGQKEPGADLLRRGLELLVKTRRWSTVQHTINRIADFLDQLTEIELGKEIDQWMKRTLPVSPKGVPQRGSTLPIKCPYCWGVLHPREVEWLDRVHATCPYCASVVHKDD
jgi:hypothetical protein